MGKRKAETGDQEKIARAKKEAKSRAKPKAKQTAVKAKPKAKPNPASKSRARPKALPGQSPLVFKSAVKVEDESCEPPVEETAAATAESDPIDAPLRHSSKCCAFS